MSHRHQVRRRVAVVHRQVRRVAVVHQVRRRVNVNVRRVRRQVRRRVTIVNPRTMILVTYGV